MTAYFAWQVWCRFELVDAGFPVGVKIMVHVRRFTTDVCRKNAHGASAKVSLLSSPPISCYELMVSVGVDVVSQQ